MAFPFNKIIELWACGCTFGSRGPIPDFDPGHPYENIRVEKLDCKCYEHTIGDLKCEYGGLYYDLLDIMNCDLAREKKLPPPPSVKPVSIIKDKPTVVGLGGYGATTPSNYVHSVRTPTRLVATISGGGERRVKPLLQAPYLKPNTHPYLWRR
jgi:hypothetical protein